VGRAAWSRSWGNGRHSKLGRRRGRAGAVQTYEALELGLDGAGEFLGAEFLWASPGGVRAAGLQPCPADVVADADQFNDQAEQALTCGDLGANCVEFVPGPAAGK